MKFEKEVLKKFEKEEYKKSIRKIVLSCYICGKPLNINFIRRLGEHEMDSQIRIISVDAIRCNGEVTHTDCCAYQIHP